MEIEQKDFERAVMLAYKRGVVRRSEPFISNEEVKEVVNDLYDLLKIENLTRQG